jgi:hypothetical protein
VLYSADEVQSPAGKLAQNPFTVQYVEVAGRQLILRPHNQALPIEGIPMQEKNPSQII